MCLRIASVIVALSVVNAHSHLLEPCLEHFSLLGETLIRITYQTLSLSSRDVHGVRVVLGWLMLTWAVVVIDTLVQVLNLRRSQICNAIAHLDWGKLWCGALSWILAHLRLIFRGCATIKMIVSLEKSILTWSFWGYGPFWRRVSQRRPLLPHSQHHPSSISSAKATVNYVVAPYDWGCPISHSRMTYVSAPCHPPCWVSSICPLKLFSIIMKNKRN